MERGLYLYNDHPLAGIDGLTVGNYRVVIKDIRPFRIKECVKFAILLEGERGLRSTSSTVEGMFSTGRGYIKSWMDITYKDQISFPPDKVISLYEEGLSPELFKILGGVLSPGGHLMVSYDDGDPIHRTTERALAMNFPPFVTPLGYLLVQAGFLSIRDWYWPEGGAEGPRKLWAESPLDSKIASERRETIVKEVEEFLRKVPQNTFGEVGESCSRVAYRVLESLKV